MIKSAILANEIAEVFPIDLEIHEAIASVRREDFLPKALWAHAYSLSALPISNGQWISSPLSVAKMTQYLKPNGADSVLEIGLGSGYQAFILSKLIRRVFSIERIAEIYNQTQARFRALSAYNITTKLDDGQFGWEAFAPYDRILLSACIVKIPELIISQLQDGGILVSPIDLSNGNFMDLKISKASGHKQVIARFVKRSGMLIGEVLEACDFVPIIDGVLK
ncbi:MAG: protein-L-isoaspartate(D-aspartate) O-methyltransferase [Helicobacter sp.]|nr:protein-L-isoaspartate(D-aspartate) O-methyltransferase [Helicobacter sp.]